MKKNIDYHNAIVNNLPESYRNWFSQEKLYLIKNILPNSSVLEIGCGTGRSISDLLLVTSNITAIDHDEKAILTAKEAFAEYETVRLLTADARKLPFDDGVFECVVCMASFMNFGTTKYEILNEMKRVLKNDGKIILSSFSEKSLPERLEAYKENHVPVKEIIGNTVYFDEKIGDSISEQFSVQELEHIFSKVGLKIEDIEEVSIAYLCTLSKST